MADTKLFSCRYGQCDYQSTQFAHTWDKHRLDRNLKYICRISSCTSSYTNHRYAKAKHSCFFDKHMEFFKNKSVPSYDGEEFLYGNGEEGQPHSNEQAGNEGSEMNDDDDDNDFELCKNIDCDDVIAEMLLDLRENHNVTTSTTRIMSEKFLALLKLDRKIFSSMIRKSLKNKSEIDTEILIILNSKSTFFQSCLRFCGQKALPNFIMTKSGFVEPEERVIGYDHET